MSDFQSIPMILSVARYFHKRPSDRQATYRAHMRDQNRSDFALRLIAARKHAGFTQIQAAKKIGMSQSSYAQSETIGEGSRLVSHMADVFGVSAHWLATGKGEMCADEPRMVTPEPSLPQALAVVAKFLQAIDHEKRIELEPWFSVLVKQPEQVSNIVNAICDVLEIPHESVPRLSHDETVKWKGSTLDTRGFGADGKGIRDQGTRKTRRN